MARHAHGVRISGAGIGMDLIIAGGMMLCQIDLTGPVPVRLLFRIVPGQVILSVLHAPDSELDLGMAVAGHIGHLDSQDIVILHRRDGVILLGPANNVLRAAAVVAIRDLRLRADAVVRGGRVVGELMGDVLFYVHKHRIDDILSIIPMDRISPRIFVKAHRNFNDPSSVILFLTLEPLDIILSVMLTPNGHFTILVSFLAQRAQHHGDYAVFFIDVALDEPVHTTIFIEVAPPIAHYRNMSPASDHRAIICAVFIRFEVVGIVTNFHQTRGHLAVVIVVGLAVGLLDKTSMTANYQAIFEHKGHFVHYLLAVVGHAVLVEAVVVLSHQEPTGLHDTAQEVHLAVGGFVTSPAGVFPLNGINGGMAVVAYQLAAAADGVCQLMALFSAAAGQRLEGQTVQKLLAAVSQNIIDVDRHLGLGRFHAQINRVELGGRLCEDLAVIEDVLAVD